MKNKEKLILAVALLASLTGCKPKYFDDLGGGGTSADTTESGDIVLPDESFDFTTTEVSNEGLISIDLNNLSSSGYYTYKNNVLSFSKSGSYELSGKLNGTIEIAKKYKVDLVLNGVEIIPLETQYTGAIVYKKENTNELTLTIKEGSTNTLYDSVNDLESYNADADEGIIVVKSSTTLTINGKGTLNLVSKSSSSTGIKVKNTPLTIQDTSINITATKNGIKGGNKVLLKNCNINIECGNDGIKTDMVTDNETDALTYASDLYSGYVFIKDSDIKINSTDDGIAADSYMHIDNGSHTIEITTNSGAPSTVTERTSDNANGKALKVGGITMEVNEIETSYPSTSDYGYFLEIDSGKFIINSNDDAIHSNGNVQIIGGEFEISTGDDGIHADYLTKIIGGNININKSYEGIEGASIEILGGNINVYASDDGINAANADLKNYNFNLYIGGGNILVNCSGDGVDSNGTIEFAGGTTIIYGPTANDNGALDADNGILMNGGTLVAIGSKGMAEIPATNSSQYCLGWNLDSAVSKNTNITLTINGKEVVNITSPKYFQSIVISSDGMKNGDKYVLKVGNSSKSGTLSSTITTYGNFSSMQPGQNGGNPRDFGGGGGGPGRR